MAVAANQRCDWGSISDGDVAHDPSTEEETFGEAAWDLRYEEVFRKAAQEEMKAAMDRLTRRFNLAEAWAQHYLREALDSLPIRPRNSNKLK